MFTRVTKPLNKGDNMPDMDLTHSQILEGYWWGLDAHEIAEQIGEDPAWVATVTDTFRDLGY